MCLSQESLDRAGVRQELMPFVYISLLNFHLSSLYKMLLFLELVVIFIHILLGCFPIQDRPYCILNMLPC